MIEIVGKGCVKSFRIGLSGNGNIQTIIVLFTDPISDIKPNQTRTYRKFVVKNKIDPKRSESKRFDFFKSAISMCPFNCFMDESPWQGNSEFAMEFTFRPQI